VKLPKHVRSIKKQSIVTQSFATLLATHGAREKLEALAAARPQLLSSVGHGKFVCDFEQLSEVLRSSKLTKSLTVRERRSRRTGVV
jgi:deoxyribodipyrimidine photolyase-like uncharacterized protein